MNISYKYRNQASNYENNIKSTLLPKLEKVKNNYKELLDMIEEPKDGDYLTSHVKEELEKEVENVELMINDINSRCLDINQKAKELDDKLTKEMLVAKEGDSDA